MGRTTAKNEKSPARMRGLEGGLGRATTGLLGRLLRRTPRPQRKP
ncbi:hypothetical protein [Proteus mirabilis]